jgi:alkaline phosphatase D
MGHPKHIKPRAPGANRRDFFKRSGTAAVALASVPLLQAPAAAASVTPLFSHGVASGDPLSDGVVLWTRVSPSAAAPAQVLVRWLVASDPALKMVVKTGTTRTSAARDHTVKVDVSGLAPATTYYYRFATAEGVSMTGRTRTLPAGAAPRLRMAVVSCSNHAAGYFNAYRRVAERADLDLVLHLGDYLYEYGSNQYGSVRPTEPPTEMLTLADYRMRHAQYKRDADLQELHRQHPMVAIWDDHEIANDAWVNGAENHSEGAEGVWPERVSQGLQAYREWMPVRDSALADPKRNQRAFRFGDLVDIVMLEERLQARSKQLEATIPVPGLGNVFTQTGDFADPARTLLGSRQEGWLAARLRTSKAKWKFIGQGVMFAHLKAQAAPLAAGGGLFFNADQWDGYQPARDRVYDMIKGDATRPAVPNVVVLTGDIHSSWANDLTQDPNNPDLASGGYEAATGNGSRAVEFVTTSITSPGLDDPSGATAGFIRSVNPHIKYVDFNQRGYALLDATPARVVCEWWYVDTVTTVSPLQTFGTAFEVVDGSNRLVPSAQTTARANPPPLAP